MPCAEMPLGLLSLDVQTTEAPRGVHPLSHTPMMESSAKGKQRKNTTLFVGFMCASWDEHEIPFPALNKAP